MMSSLSVHLKMLFLVLLVLLSVSLSSCRHPEVTSDIDAYSPTELLEKNDLVCLGEYLSAETVEHLGPTEYLLDTVESYLVSYSFRAVEVFKGDLPNKEFSIWYILMGDEQHDRLGSILSRCDTVLIYGNHIRSRKDVIQSARPYFSKQVSALDAVDTAGSVLSRSARLVRSLSRYLTSSEDVEGKFVEDSVLGHQVFYITDYQAESLYEFCRDNTVVYSSGHGWWRWMDSRDAYIDDVRRLAKSQRGYESK